MKLIKEKFKISYKLPDIFIHDIVPIKSVKNHFMLKRMRHKKSFMGKIQRTIGNFIRMLPGLFFKRTAEFVDKIYAGTEPISAHEWYEKQLKDIKYRIDGFNVIKSNRILLKSVLIQILHGIFKQMNAKTILEVGSGNGINLIGLASLDPEYNLIGVEPSKNSYLKSITWKDDEKDIDVVGFGNTLEQVNFNKIKFINGTGFSIPLEDKSVDVSFTCAVLEQIPRDYGKVLIEMRRVTRKYCVFIEEFKEAQSLPDYFFLYGKDMFRSSYKNFKKYGLEPVYFTTDFTQKTTHSLGLLIARV